MAKPVITAASVETEETVVPVGTIVQNDETREMFAGCEDGDEKWVLVRIDTHDDASIAFTPLEVEYEEEAEEAVTGDTPKAIRKISKAGY